MKPRTTPAKRSRKPPEARRRAPAKPKKKDERSVTIAPSATPGPDVRVNTPWVR